MHVLAPPEQWIPIPEETTVFLAGGISGCPQWQDTVIDLLADTSLTLLNPRRTDFPIGDPAAAEGQIRWEYQHLHYAQAILFWFPAETLCPITLFELGRWSGQRKPLFVGIHPEYKRRQDIEVQLGLERPDVSPVYSLDDLAASVRSFTPNKYLTGYADF